MQPGCTNDILNLYVVKNRKMKKEIIILMAACMCIAGCHHSSTHSHEGEEHHEGGHSDEIEFSEEKQELFGIGTEVVAAAPLAKTIKVGGQVLPSIGDEAVAVAPVSGTIVFSGRMTEGSTVAKGSSLAEISTKGLAGGDVIAKAKTAYEIAKTKYERDRDLLADNIVSRNHFEQSELAYEQAKAEYEALVSDTSADKANATVKCPLGGYIKELNVTSGEYVEAGTAIATIAQNKTLQLRADLPERYAAELREINDATFRNATGEVLSVSGNGGRLVSYSRNVQDGYIPVIFEFPNRSGIIPGTYTEVCLRTATKESAISVPVGAIIEEQGIYSVFIRLDEDCFAKREVRIGGSDGIRTEILSGLAEGEEIVSEGAMHIKLASVASAPAGHNHNH